jgi:tripartite-type tricarboxylate transporter receptor subunit TctC
MRSRLWQVFHRAAVAAVVAVSLTAFLAWGGRGASPESPRTIKVIVPFPPGGLQSDILTRLLADQIGRAQGVTMVVENRPGAGTAVGTQAASHARPDGNTLLMISPAFVINPQLRQLDYDPVASFAPICHLASAPIVLVVDSASSFRTLADLVEAAREPGRSTVATTPGTLFHIVLELLKRAGNTDPTLVPFTGGVPALNALLGHHVTSALINYGDVAQYMKEGRLRALAVFSRQRIAIAPEIPSIAESGYPQIEAEGWFGLVAPAQTPQKMISQFADWITTALREPQISGKLIEQGISPVGTCGDAFGALIREKYNEYGRVIREANIKAE